MKRLLGRQRAQARIAADAAALRGLFNGGASREAQRRIAGEVARGDMAGVRHWTAVWAHLMRAPDERRRAA